MEERIISVIIEDPQKQYLELSIEQYNALANKKQVSIFCMISNTGYRYRLYNGSINISWLIDPKKKKTVYLFMILTGNYKMHLPDIGVDIVGPNASIYDIEVFKKYGIQIKPDGYWVSWSDESRVLDIQDYLNNNKEANEQIINAMNIIKRFEPIAGKNITLRQLKTFIEIGKLFETNEERKEFEKSILQMQAAETDRLQRLNQIEKEIEAIKAQLSVLQSESGNLIEESKVVKHSLESEL